MPRTTIRSEDITDDQITTDTIAVGAVNAQEIGANAVDTSEIAANAVTPAQMANSAFLANRNYIINGDFDVWQRGTTFNISAAGPGEFTADRWKFMGDNFTGSLTRNAFATNQTDVPDCPAYYVRWINNTTMSPGQKSQFLTPIELIPNGHKLANQEVTFSCWLRSAAGTIPDGNVTLIKESAVYPSVGAITTTWTKFTHTWTVWNSNQPYMWIGFECPATYALLGGIDIAHCQLELGDTATPFEHKTFGEELDACQRYYCKSFSYSVVPAQGNANVDGAMLGKGVTSYDTEPFISWQYPRVMRATPTITLYNPRAAGTSGQWDNWSNASGASARVIWANDFCVRIDNGDGKLAAANAWIIHATAAAEL
jgi:hypothetical protein